MIQRAEPQTFDINSYTLVINFIKNSLNTILVCHALVFILCVVDNQNTYKWQLPGGSKYYQKRASIFFRQFQCE